MTLELPGTSRRRIIVGAAWTAPVIVAASAVPALAASGPAVVTTAPSGVMDLTINKVAITITFENQNTGTTGNTPLTVNLTPTTGVDSFGTFVQFVGGDAGFTFGTTAGNITNRQVIFANATGIPGTADASSPPRTSTLTFTINGTFTVGTGTITTVATPSSGAVAPGSGTYAPPT